ncbi:MAG: hypothetical protein DLM50_08390 [Candidatus Meridianibacter frigidus]|nr:MAG: hypothetical protein DLM50_08390 [Candidatus Eremiobacteraeota bacterium]
MYFASPLGIFSLTPDHARGTTLGQNPTRHASVESTSVLITDHVAAARFSDLQQQLSWRHQTQALYA